MRSICHSKIRLLTATFVIVSLCVLSGCRSNGGIEIPRLSDLAWWNQGEGAIARSDSPAPPALHFSPDSAGMDEADTEQLRENLNQILAGNNDSTSEAGAPIRQPYGSGGEMDSQFFELEEPSNFDPLTGRMKTDLPGTAASGEDPDAISPEALANALEQNTRSFGGNSNQTGGQQGDGEWRNFDLPKPEFGGGGSFDNALSAVRDSLNRDIERTGQQFGQAAGQVNQFAQQEIEDNLENAADQVGQVASGGAFPTGGQFAPVASAREVNTPGTSTLGTSTPGTSTPDTSTTMSEETRELANRLASSLGQAVENTAEQVQSTYQSGGAFGQQITNEFMGAGERVADAAAQTVDSAREGFSNVAGNATNSGDALAQQRIDEMQQTINDLQQQLATREQTPQRLESVGPSNAFSAETPVASGAGGVTQSSFGGEASGAFSSAPRTNYQSTGAPEFPSFAPSQTPSAGVSSSGESVRLDQPDRPSMPRNILRGSAGSGSRMVYPETGAGEFDSSTANGGSSTADSLSLPAPSFGGSHYAPGSVRTELPPRQ